LSHCRSCWCSRCGDMSDCYIIQNGESSSGNCCIRWDVKVQETWSCTTVDWDRKLLVVETGTSFGIGTDNRLKAELSFVSDFRGFVEKFAWSLDSISFARCIPLKSFRKMSLLLRCESNAFPNVRSKRKIAINVSRIRSMFI
jgi:hypothetical protein